MIVLRFLGSLIVSTVGKTLRALTVAEGPLTMWLKLILRRIIITIEICTCLIETSEVVKLRISHKWLRCVIQMNSISADCTTNWGYEGKRINYVLRLEFLEMMPFANVIMCWMHTLICMECLV